MDVKKIVGLFFLLWAGAFVVFLVMHVAKGPDMSQAMSTVVWEELTSESFFYGAIGLAVYNLYTRRQRMEDAEKARKRNADAEPEPEAE